MVRFSVIFLQYFRSLVKHLKLVEFIEKSDFQAWPSSSEELSSSWIKVLFSCIRKKDGKIFPLPKIRSTKEEAPLLFSQLMQYVSQTNYINLWKKIFKMYSTNESQRETKISLTDYNTVLKEIITRIYGCPIINAYDESLSVTSSAQFEVHLNIFPALCAVETQKAIILIHAPYMEYNISDCVTFSPAILDKNHTKSLFIIYQLLNVLKSLHERSLTLGEISLSDIYITEDMWIYIFPQIISNIHAEENFNTDSEQLNKNVQSSKLSYNQRYQFYGSQLYDAIEVNNQSLSELSHLWINGLISNFTYISALNKFSGKGKLWAFNRAQKV